MFGSSQAENPAGDVKIHRGSKQETWSIMWSWRPVYTPLWPKPSPDTPHLNPTFTPPLLIGSAWEGRLGDTNWIPLQSHQVFKKREKHKLKVLSVEDNGNSRLRMWDVVKLFRHVGSIYRRSMTCNLQIFSQ